MEREQFRELPRRKHAQRRQGLCSRGRVRISGTIIVPRR